MDAMANPTSSDVNPAVMALAYDGEWYSFADFVDWYEQDGQRVWDDARTISYNMNSSFLLRINPTCALAAVVYKLQAKM